MRWRRLLLRGAAITVGVLLVLFGALQTGVGQRLLFDTVASLASSPERTVRLKGPSGFFPTNLSLEQVEVADAKGVWLAATNVEVSWSLLPLFGGRVDIDTVRAARLDVHRAPESPETQPREEQPSEGPPRLPRISLGKLVISELYLGKALTGTDSLWQVEASARLDGPGGDNLLLLTAARRDDRQGRLALQVHYEGTGSRLTVEGDFEEGEGGVLAAVLGRPDLPRTSGRVTAEVSGERGQAQVALDAGDALHISGSGQVRPEGNGRHVAASLEIRGGRLPDPMWAAALAQPATIEADLLLGPADAVDVRSLRLAAAPLEATASGRYEPGTGRLQLHLSATGGDPAMLAALVPGAGWRDLRLQIEAEGRLAALDATLSLQAAELRTAQATAADVDVSVSTRGANLEAGPALRASVRGALASLSARSDKGELSASAMRLDATVERTTAGAIAVPSLNLTSSLLTAAGSGRLSADRTLAADVTLDVPDLSALNPMLDWPVAGAAHVVARASGTTRRPAVTAEATVRDATVPSVPPALLTPVVTATLNGAFGRDGSWQLERASIASDAMSIEGRGSGRNDTGTIDVSFAFPNLGALDPRVTGRLNGDIHVEATADRRNARVTAQIVQAQVDRTSIERLDLDVGLALQQDGFEATLAMNGATGERPIRANGRVIATQGERLSIPTFEASLGTTTLSIRDLLVDRNSADGSAHLVVENLKELGALIDDPSAAGRLELSVVPDPTASESRLKITLRGTGLSLGGTGTGTLTGDGTIADPLGRAAFDVKVTAEALRGVADLRKVALEASGDRTAIAATIDAAGAGTAADVALKAQFGDETILDIEKFRGSYAGQPISLAQAARIRVSPTRTHIEPLRLTVAGGQVRIGGTIDETNSDLALNIGALALADVARLAGLDLQVSGALQAELHMKGARDRPQIDATYSIRDARLRDIATASVPPMSLTGKATLRDQALNADARLAAGASNLALNVSARLPPQGGAPDGQVKVTGPVDLAIFASLLGPDIQQVRGRAIFDVALASRGGQPRGTGTVRLEGLGLALPSQGLELAQGTGLIRLAEDRIILERLAFPAVGKGDIAASGEVRLNKAMSLPIDLRVETRHARLANRRHLVAEITASLRLTGSVAEGLNLQGPIRIDRAEIGLALGNAAKAVPVVPVREVGAGAPKQGKRSAPSKPMALDLKISAPRAVFVRGKGLDAEVEGNLNVTGTTANPVVTGGLSLRRGTYTVLGRPLRFTRANITFVNANRIEPALDLLATTRSGDTSIEIAITGTASEPKIALTSTPQLPQDEIMARFLFNKGAAELGPSELVQVAQAIAELTGNDSSGGAIDSARRALGLDRLNIGQSDTQGTNAGGNGVSGAGVEGGRYIAPGVYVGGRQGLQGDTRGVVQIEVIPHVKVEGEFGTNSTGRAGIALEYDY